MALTSRSEWPVIVAISGTVQPASASRVTAVPRKSWKVTPATPALMHAVRQDVRKPLSVHAVPDSVARTVMERSLSAALAASLRLASSQCSAQWSPSRDDDADAGLPLL